MLGYFDANDGSPKVVLKIKGTRQKPKEIVALFDTGHSGSLSLPVIDLIEIGAKLDIVGEVEHADGILRPALYFSVKVTIDNIEKQVRANMIENKEATEAIAGLELFSPYVALIDFKNKRISFIEEKKLHKKSI